MRVKEGGNRTLLALTKVPEREERNEHRVSEGKAA
jgi:hypothetical protein